MAGHRQRRIEARPRRRPLALLAALALGLALPACGGSGDGNGDANGDAAPPGPSRPAGTAVEGAPAITVTAVADRYLDRHVFVLRSDEETVVLDVAAPQRGIVGRRVSVTGVLREFRLAEVEERYDLDLDAEALRPVEARQVLVASAVALAAGATPTTAAG